MPKSRMGRAIHERILPSTGFVLHVSLSLVLFTVLASGMAYAETVSASVNGESFNIEYTSSGVSVSAVDSSIDTASLIFDVSVPDGAGTLVVTFERSFFDSIRGGLDEEFDVLADGDFPVFEETSTTTQSRTLSIDLPAGTSEVEVLGSSLAGENLYGDVAEPEPEPPKPVPAPDTQKTQCGAGTTLVDGQCVLEKKCGAGTTLVDGQCVLEKKCGAGTKLVDGQCVLEEKKCGAGTTLVDGLCVLDDTCGAGTILVDGQCVLEQTKEPFSLKSLGKELGTGFFIAFAAAGVLGVILGLIAKAHRSKN
ncbi:MAG: hypothetical protein D9C04_07215 [Nitrosopumilus sp. B06]|nr:MAG: hypothetical protein D9C04_07215 [Nitrosopumilus sp. B06]